MAIKSWRAGILALQQEFERVQTRFPPLYHLGMFSNAGQKNQSRPTQKLLLELSQPKQPLVWGDRWGGAYHYAFMLFSKEGMGRGDYDHALSFMFDMLKIGETVLRELPQEIKEEYLPRCPDNLSDVGNDHDCDWWVVLYHLAWQKPPGLLRSDKKYWMSDLEGTRMVSGIDDIDAFLATNPANREVYPGCWVSELATDIWKSCEHACRFILGNKPGIGGVPEDPAAGITPARKPRKRKTDDDYRREIVAVLEVKGYDITPQAIKNEISIQEAALYRVLKTIEGYTGKSR